MGVMRAVGTGHRPPANAKVRADAREYVVELDVSDFLESELDVELVGTRISVRGNQSQDPGDDGIPFRLQERVEESFRLPDESTRTDQGLVWAPRRCESARRDRGSSLARCRSGTGLRTSAAPTRCPAERRRDVGCNPNSPPRGEQASPQAVDGPVDGHRARRRQHGRLGHLHAAGVLAGEAGPVSIVSLAFTGARRDAARARLRQPRPCAPHTGGPYYFARRAFGDFVGFQTAWAYWIAAWVGNAAIAVAFAGYLGVFWGDVNTSNWLAAARRRRRGLAVHAREHPRRARRPESPRC